MLDGLLINVCNSKAFVNMSSQVRAYGGICVHDQLVGVVCVGEGLRGPVAAHLFCDVSKVVSAAKVPQHGSDVLLHGLPASPPAFRHNCLSRHLCAHPVTNPACSGAVRPDAGWDG